MKKLLLILFCLPLFGFGQNCTTIIPSNNTVDSIVYCVTNTTTCFDTCDGAIYITIYGDSLNGPYSFEWFNNSTPWVGISIQDTLCAGSYIITITNVNGDLVDSSHINVVNEPPNVLVYDTVTAVGSYTWGFYNFTSSGDYTDTLTNSASCDSIINLNLNILPSPDNLFFSEYAEGSSSNRYLEIYNPTPDTIDLTNYALARVSGSPGNGVGIYEYWVDFDSGAVILPYDVYIVAHSSADALILAEANMTYISLSNGDDGFALVYGNNPGIPTSPFNGNYQILDWLGDWLGDPGQGWEVAGVSNATRNHTLLRKCPINQGDTSWPIAAGTDPINSQWIVLSQDNWTNIGFHSTCICDSSTNSYTAITDTICNGLSIVVGNNTYDSTGVYSDTLLAFNGCDSIITTNLTVLNSSASNVINDTTICDGDSFVVGSSVYNLTGSYTDILVNSAGCDSIITTNLTIQTPTYQDKTICDGDSIAVGNSIYNSTGSYTDTIQSSIGCDSIVYTNLTIYSQLLISGGISDNTVGGGGYYSGSQYLELSCYMGSELVSAVVYSADTTLTTFQIRDDNGVVLDSVTVNVIPGGHRIYFNYLMSAGSDYELGVSGASNGLFRNNSGVNYPYNFANAAAVTSSSAGGNYYYFFYDIQIRALSTAALTTNYTFCDGDSVTIAGNVYTTTGLYTDSLISLLGCDSLVYSNVVVSSHVSYTNNQTICNGETYLINGNIYDSTGIYIDSLTTLTGCDSIVTTNLYVDSIVGGVGINNDTICIRDSIMVGSNIYYNEGVYNDTLISSNGCDSIITTILSVISANYATINGGILYPSASSPGDYSNYDGYLILDVGILSLLKSANVYAVDTNTITFELRDDNGGVIQAVTHTVYPGLQSLSFNFMIQPGTDYQLGIDGGNSGLYRNNAGNGNSLAYPFDIGPVSITSSNAGDQYYYFYYDIAIMPYATYIFSNICDGDSVIVGSSIYDTTGNYIDIFNASNSCDSIVYTDLLIDYTTYSYDTLFVTASIVWNGMTLNVSGDYSVTLINSAGCDSIANLNLTVTTTGILDMSENKRKVVKITDILGKETPYRKHISLFYIYDDGTVEKRIVIE